MHIAAYCLIFLAINCLPASVVIRSGGSRYVSIHYTHSWSQICWAETFFSYHLARKLVVLLTKYKTSLLSIYIMSIIILWLKFNLSLRINVKWLGDWPCFCHCSQCFITYYNAWSSIFCSDRSRSWSKQYTDGCLMRQYWRCSSTLVR